MSHTVTTRMLMQLSRIKTLTQELLRLTAVTEHRPDPSKSVGSCIQDFLRANSEWSFSPSEIMVAVHVREEAVRKALQRLVARGLIEWRGHAAYGASPGTSR